MELVQSRVRSATEPACREQGALGLWTAIAEDREPYNSARHNLLSLQLTLAACRSAEEDARPVSLDELTA